MDLEEYLKNANDEQKEQLQNCKTEADVKKLLADEGIELTEEQLEAVSGGLVYGSNLENGTVVGKSESAGAQVIV